METRTRTATNNAAASSNDVKSDWLKAYTSQPEEFAYWIDDIDGTIPPDLHGTFFRNGPGLLDVNGRVIHHPFDGDGMVRSIAFADGRAFFRSRFVRTEEYLAEQQAGTILYRSVFGTQRPGGWLANMFDRRLKHPANTNIIYWSGKLWALWEGGKPYRLDPVTLETLGKDSVGGLLQPGQPFAAHPHLDPFSHWDAGEPMMVTFSLQPGLTTRVTIYEINRAGRTVRQQTHAIPEFAFLHDIAITPNYYIFVQNSLSYNPLPYLLGWRGAADCIVSQPDRPTRVLLIPRHPSVGPMRVFETDPGFVWHHANAFEQDHVVCLDSVWYDSFASVDPDGDFRDVEFDKLSHGELWRTRLNLNTGTAERHRLSLHNCEFPVIHPAVVGRPYRYVFLDATEAPVPGAPPLQAVLKLDLQTGEHQIWSAAPRGFVDEPIFVPRPRTPGVADATTTDVGDPIGNTADGEDNGWLLSLYYDAAHHRSTLAILDARDLTAGPIARLHLRQHMPVGLHGSFTSRWLGPAHGEK